MSTQSQKNGGVNIFAEHAHGLRDAGLAVLPLAPSDKEPEIAGFTKWRGRPSHKSISGWAKKFPDSNIGYLPGLSGLVVVDDDGGAADRIVETFGETPVKVQSRRGAHYFYRKPRGDMPKVVSLRSYGLNADLKHGHSIVVAPPSVHETGHVYGWLGCDADALKSLPVFPVDPLQKLLDSRKAKTQDQLKSEAGFRGTSRELQLNDFLLRHVMNVEDVFELIDIAKTWNDDLPDRGINSLTGDEVMKMVRAIWKDRQSGKLECFHGRRATVKVVMSEMDVLSAHGKEGTTLAFPLLVKLRGEHSGRMARGETFALNQGAMVREQTMPGWTRYDYEKARKVLLAAGFVQIVEDGRNSRTGRVSTRYKLAEPTVTR